METSEHIGELAAALAKVQAQIKHPAKTKTAGMGKYSYRYADLGDVIQAAMPLLAANGLAVVQAPTSDGAVVHLDTILMHTSGQWIKSRLTMIAKDASPQAIGGTITYARRYSFSSIIGVVADDDDDAQSAQPAPSVTAHPGRSQGGVASDVPAPAPTAPVDKKPPAPPTGFDAKNASHVEALARALTAKSVPMQQWPWVTNAMAGKPFTQLDQIIKETGA